MKKTQTITNELLTLRDFIRYGTSCFNEAGLSYGHGTDNAYDEAVYLVLETLHLPINQLEPYLDARLTESERKKLENIINKRLKTRKPAAYLTNKAYVQDIPFYVDERVIVPRSLISEILCNGEIGIDNPETVKSVLDICTGSGCLAILAAHVFPNATIHATDISSDALDVAKWNINDSCFKNRITTYKGDLFKPIKENIYDLIIANPPYTEAEAMTKLPPEYSHEPKLALAAGKDGLDIVRRILAQAHDYLSSGGMLLCEIGRGRTLLESEYPHLDFLWLDTEENSGKVFRLQKSEFTII